jgi:hypothetical protein
MNLIALGAFRRFADRHGWDQIRSLPASCGPDILHGAAVQWEATMMSTDGYRFEAKEVPAIGRWSGGMGPACRDANRLCWSILLAFQKLMIWGVVLLRPRIISAHRQCVGILDAGHRPAKFGRHHGARWRRVPSQAEMK